MEFPDVGAHCAVQTCNQLDFLPFTCSRCKLRFCQRHWKPADHACAAPAPPSGPPPPPSSSQQHHAGASHGGASRSSGARRAPTNPTYACSLPDCKTREPYKIMCPECNRNFCAPHRHPDRHRCKGSGKGARRRAASAPHGSSSANEGGSGCAVM